MAAKQVDVVIVGGGLAGLSAALQLKDTGGVTYVVLEGDGRLGGRTKTGTSAALDYGGGYVGSSQNYIQFLIRRFNIKMVKQYLPVDGFWIFQGADKKFQRFPGDNPLDMPGSINAQVRLGELDTLALSLRSFIDRPWDSPLARAYDSMTVQDWIGLQTSKWTPAGDPTIGMSPETADAFVASVRSAFSLEPSELSFFFLLYYAATAGSYAAIVDVAGGDGAAEATRFLLGTQSLVDALRQEIGDGNIAMNSKVEGIDCSDARLVTVSTRADEWKAKQVIVAMSPPVSQEINYSRAGETAEDSRDWAARMKLCRAMARCKGRTIKGFVRFKDEFWRYPKEDPNRGPDGPGQIRMGYLLSTSPHKEAPLDWTLDNVWENAHGYSPAPGSKERYLMTFIVGDSASYWASQSFPDRATAVIEHLKSAYGFDDTYLFDSTNPANNYSEENWVTPGLPAPGAMMPPNTLSDPGLGQALRSPVGRLHWAGSETATEWCGYMDGAVQSGLRAAGEVLRALGTSMAAPLNADGFLGCFRSARGVEKP